MAERARLTPERERVLAWDGCINVRDLGGLPLKGGGATRFRVVVRADSIRGLTDYGWRAVLDYGVERAIDLRSDAEVAADTTGDVPIPVLRIPIDGAEPAATRDWPSMHEAYLALLEHFHTRFAAAMVEIARAEVPLVIHCHGGRDRTGLVVALMLQLAGVEPEAIAADHARSDESWAPMNDAWFAEAPTEAERERRKRVAMPAGRTMVEILEELEPRFGGVSGYLLAGGASPEDLDSIVLRLRGDAPDGQ